MKAILITPDHALGKIVVSSVDIAVDEEGEPSLDSLRGHLQCQIIDVVQCDEHGALRGHCAILDESGLYAENPGYTWCQQIGPQPYAGRILLMQLTHNGGTTDASVDAQTVRALPGMVYLLPHMAALAAKRHEEAILSAFPDIIMIPWSGIVQDQIATHTRRHSAL